MNRYSLIRIALLVCVCGYCITGLAADEELLGVVGQKLGSPENPNIAPFLDHSSVADSSMPNTQSLKKLFAFGVTFSGRAKLADDEFNTVSYWSDESKLKSAVAEATFNAIASKLQQRHGPAKTADVPNYEDASASVTHVLRWHVVDEVILLYVHIRSPYANLGLVRIKQAAWLADMGAGEREFWEKTLKASGPTTATSPPSIEQPSTQPPSSQVAPPAIGENKVPPMASPSAPEPSETKPGATSEEKVSSTSLLVWGVIVMAVIGLVWLLLKRRN
jgi:hypothetical protein